MNDLAYSELLEMYKAMVVEHHSLTVKYNAVFKENKKIKKILTPEFCNYILNIGGNENEKVC